MKKYIVERTEMIRRRKTWEVEAESKDEAINIVYDNEPPPKSTSDKFIDSDTDCWEAK